jgi:hypothetical protein
MSIIIPDLSELVGQPPEVVLEALQGISIRTWIDSPELFGPFFEASSWDAWRPLFLAACAEPMTRRERKMFKSLTGFDYKWPCDPPMEIYIAASRRCGKTVFDSTLGLFHAVTKSYKGILRPGERPLIPLIAKDKTEAKALFQYCEGAFEEIPLLRGLLEGKTSSTLRLINGTEIEIRSPSFRSIRGRSIPFAAVDESAYMFYDGACPDHELIASLRPSLQTLNGQLVVTSSVYGMFGVLYEAWKRYSDGHDPSVLALKADIHQLNPSVSQAWLDKQQEMDPEKFAREYMSEWQIGLAAFVDRDTIFNLVVPGRKELPPSGHQYKWFVDANGGAGQDEFAITGAHTIETESGHRKVVIDCTRGIRNGRPADITKEFSDLMKSYGSYECTGDAYSGDWCSDEFGRNGISFTKSEKNKSELYLAAIHSVRQGLVELLDDKIANLQWCALERKTSKVGKDVVSHPMIAGARDDRANTQAGAITMCTDESDELSQYFKLLDESKGPFSSLEARQRRGETIWPDNVFPGSWR